MPALRVPAMPSRQASCHCGQLRLEATGEPFAVSICNCLACQRRTGSAADALAQLERAIALVDGFRELARGDADFDPIRHDPAFVELVGPAVA